MWNPFDKLPDTLPTKPVVLITASYIAGLAIRSVQLRKLSPVLIDLTRDQLQAMLKDPDIQIVTPKVHHGRFGVRIMP